MTKAEYAEYEKTVAAFFEREGITNLSPTNGTTFFSHRRCDCCGDIPGDREKANGWNPTVEQVQEYSVCEDCVYYAEYGRLDDSTMWDIEHGTADAPEID